MGARERLAGEVTDPDGRSVVLLARIWEGKISRDHPELEGHLDEVLRTVATPDQPNPTRKPIGAAITGATSVPVAG